MIISKISTVKWNAKNKNKFVELGYVYTKMGDEFKVNINDLAPYSKSKIIVLCDYCGVNNFKTTLEHRTSNAKRDVCKKDVCNECLHLKIEESNMIKYGTKHHISSNLVRNKIKKTVQQKYGVENVFQSEEIKERIINTNIKKYGVKYFTQTEEYNVKRAITCLEKYGATSHMKIDYYKNMFKGENSPVWKNDVEYIRAERSTFEYRYWRKSVFNRDFYTCKHCNIKGGILEAHHIHSFKTSLDLRYDINNGITLCKKCHAEFHKNYGKIENNINQLNEFLLNHDKDICRPNTNYEVLEHEDKKLCG
jgi:hypothetical protein